MHLGSPKPKTYLENTLLVFSEYISDYQKHPWFFKRTKKITYTPSQIYLGITGSDAFRESSHTISSYASFGQSSLKGSPPKEPQLSCFSCFLQLSCCFFPYYFSIQVYLGSHKIWNFWKKQYPNILLVLGYGFFWKSSISPPSNRLKPKSTKEKNCTPLLHVLPQY